MENIIHCKNGYAPLIKELKKLSKPLIVCGGAAKRLEIFKLITSELKSFALFSDYSPNPSYESAVSGTAIFLESGCDSIIAIGGGSAMDIAKCIKCFSPLDQKKELISQKPQDLNPLPFFAIPTTAGTGSEATHFAVIYLKGEKISVAHKSLVPDKVIIDPSVLDSLPLYQRKATAMDAVCHAIEAFWSVNSTTESKEYSRQALLDIEATLSGYLSNLPDKNEEMLFKANLAGKAINLAKTTAAHAMSYKLSSLYGISHGHAAAICLREVWKELLEQRDNDILSSTLLELARAMGKESAQEGYEFFCNMLSVIELEAPRATEDELLLLTESVNLQRLKNTPVSFDHDTIYKMYKRMLYQNGR